ncbi:MAG: SDR family oxidoreductase [Chloroflexi bacterium]|nr:SDR family oxidoreductase [Chloroflexota bacterium]
MGRAFVDGYLQAGARVAALDLSWAPTGASNDVDDSWMRAMQARDDLLALTCDITDERQVEDAFQATTRRFGTVDALCNNAGMLQRHLFPPGGPVKVLETTNEHFRRMYDVTVFGTLNVTRAFVRPMITQRRGSIFTVISSGALMRSEGGAYAWWRPDSREQPYMSAKSAIANIMGYLGDELRADNVAVNTFVPLHTRSTGFDEWADAREKGRGSRGTTPYHPRHVQPIGCFLADQDAASGNTGKIWVAQAWLPEHGYPLSDFLAPEDQVW